MLNMKIGQKRRSEIFQELINGGGQMSKGPTLGFRMGIKIEQRLMMTPYLRKDLNEEEWEAGLEIGSTEKDSNISPTK